MMGGRQVVHLGSNCLKLGTFQHEIMHALGFIHEHSRPDRDRYVEILFDNIKVQLQVFLFLNRMLNTVNELTKLICTIGCDYRV